MCGESNVLVIEFMTSPISPRIFARPTPSHDLTAFLFALGLHTPHYEYLILTYACFVRPSGSLIFFIYDYSRGRTRCDMTLVSS